MTASGGCSWISAVLSSLSKLSWCLLFLFSFFLSLRSLSGSSRSNLSWDLVCSFFGRRGSKAKLRQRKTLIKGLTDWEQNLTKSLIILAYVKTIVTSTCAWIRTLKLNKTQKLHRYIYKVSTWIVGSDNQPLSAKQIKVRFYGNLHLHKQWTMGYPSDPGLEGELSEETEVTEATDSGLWEEGIVKERTMDVGRVPRRSSPAG